MGVGLNQFPDRQPVSGFAGRDIPKWSRAMVRLGRKPQGLTTLPARVVDGVVTVSLD